MMNNIVIEVQNLSKFYRLGLLHNHSYSFRDTITTLMKKEKIKGSDATIWALKNVSFKVKKGEIVGIIGRNGSGKTTLLKILSRITTPTEGHALIKGRIGSLLEVGTGFHPELTGRENIYLNGAILGMKKDEIKNKYDSIIEFAGIHKFINTPVKRYSSGMFVRLAFAVAAHLEPDILLVDEVLAVGDVEFQKKALGKMREVSSSEGRTVLFVSHNMGSIQQLTKRCILLDKGKILIYSETSSVVEKYLNINKNKNIDFIKSNDPGIQINTLEAYTENDDFNSCICIKVLMNYSIEYHNLIFGFGVNNSLNNRILTAYKNVKILPRGEKNIIFTIKDHRLSPGSYSLDFGLRKGASSIAFEKNAIYFDVKSHNLPFPKIALGGDKIGVFIEPDIDII